MLPGPAEIAAAAVGLAREGLLIQPLLASLGRVVCGLGLGFAIGVPLGLVSGASRIAELVFDKPVQMLRAIPFNALAPLLIILLGVGESMKISLIVIGVFVPLYLNTRNGVIHFDAKLLELSLDAFTRREMQDLLAALVREYGLSVIMVTHDREEARRFMDTAFVLEKRKTPRRICVGTVKPRQPDSCPLLLPGTALYPLHPTAVYADNLQRALCSPNRC